MNNLAKDAAASLLLKALIELNEEAFRNMAGGAGHLIDNARDAIALAKAAGIVPAPSEPEEDEDQ